MEYRKFLPAEANGIEWREFSKRAFYRPVTKQDLMFLDCNCIVTQEWDSLTGQELTRFKRNRQNGYFFALGHNPKEGAALFTFVGFKNKAAIRADYTLNHLFTEVDKLILVND